MYLIKINCDLFIRPPFS